MTARRRIGVLALARPTFDTAYAGELAAKARAARAAVGDIVGEPSLLLDVAPAPRTNPLPAAGERSPRAVRRAAREGEQSRNTVSAFRDSGQ